MTYHKVVTLWCDSEDCIENYEYDRSSVVEAREYASKDGWTTANPGDGETRDYCPDCSEKEHEEE